MGKRYPLTTDWMSSLQLKNGNLLISIGTDLFEIRAGKLFAHNTFDNFITNLFEDSRGRLWITTYGSGARMYPPGRSPATASPRLFFPETRISCVTEDREGGYWFSSYQEGVFYVPNLSVLELAANKLEKAESFQEMLLVGPELYAATSRGRVFRGTIQRPLLPLSASLAKATTFTCNDVVYDSVRQQLYVCYSNGAHLYDITSGRLQLIYPISSRSALINQQASYLLSPMAIRLDLDTGHIIYALPSNSFCLQHDKNGRILVGTDRGLYHFEPGSPMVQLHPAIINTRVSSIKLLANGWTALGTLGRGLILLKDGAILSIPLDKSHPANMVNDIAAKGDTVWAATESGIASVQLNDPYRPLVKMLYTDNRFPHNNTRKITYHDGQLVVLAQNKLIGIPAGSTGYLQAPPIFLQQVIVNDSLRLQPSNPHRFGYNKQRIKFAFNGICFYCGPNIRYQYRLVGLHNEWYNTGQPYVEYASLAPGQYTFEVVAVTPSGIASAQAASYTFTIPTPLWQKNWFKMLALLLGMALVGWLIYRRIKTIQHRNQQKEWLLAKEQLALSAQINPHFLFNSLNSIQHLIIREDRQEAVLHMARFSRLMRLSLDNSRKKWVPVADEIELLRLYLDLESLRFKDKFVYTVEADKILLNSNYRIPAMLIQPFVENAVLHGVNNLPDGKGLITVSLQFQEGLLRARIADNGVGRAKAAQLRQQAAQHSSAGMQITEQRLLLLCRETHTPWMFETIDNCDAEGQPTGTTVVFNMPWLQAAKNNSIVSKQ